MTEDLRTFKNPSGIYIIDGGNFVIKLSTIAQVKDLPAGYEVEESYIRVKGGGIKSDRGTPPKQFQFYLRDEASPSLTLQEEDFVEIRNADGHPLWLNYNYVCPVCGKNDNKNHHHVIRVVSGRGERLALIINLQLSYHSSESKALSLAAAADEMDIFFHGKKFNIQPSRLMLTKDHENNVLLGEAHVASYIAIEV